MSAWPAGNRKAADSAAGDRRSAKRPVRTPGIDDAAWCDVDQLQATAAADHRNRIVENVRDVNVIGRRVDRNIFRTITYRNWHDGIAGAIDHTYIAGAGATRIRATVVGHINFVRGRIDARHSRESSRRDLVGVIGTVDDGDRAGTLASIVIAAKVRNVNTVVGGINSQIVRRRMLR